MAANESQLKASNNAATGTAITIGNFDAMHRGHQAIVQQCGELAQRVVALTFDQHPAAVLRPGTEPPRVTTTAQRVDLLKAAGADEVVVMPTDDSILQLSAEDFVRSLVDEYSPTVMVEGADFRFGKGRAGDVAMLRALGERFGFDVVMIEPVDVDLHDQQQVQVSSSVVRHLIGHGRVADAARCLGRPFALQGQVVQGEQRGRTIGIPTANLDLTALDKHIMPANGVYGGRVVITDVSRGEHVFPGAISVGVKPTFGVKQLTIEAHLLGFDEKLLGASGELYGATMTIHFETWVRDQYAFPSLEALVAQLQRDIETVADFAASGG